MSTVDLGSASNSGGSLKYTATTDAETVKPNDSYLLSFLVSRLNIDDSAAVEGDFIRFKTDYAQTDKTLTFSKPVVIGNDLFTNGEITISNELELYFNGFTWQDSCNSTAPIVNVGTDVFTASGVITNTYELGNVSATSAVPLYVTVKMCGAGTSSKMVSGVNTGGAGAGFAAIEFVALNDELNLEFDVAAYQANADGASSILKKDGLIILETSGGGYDSRKGGEFTLNNISTFLYAGGKQGGDAAMTKGASGLGVSTKYGNFSGGWGSTYDAGGSASGLGNGAGRNQNVSYGGGGFGNMAGSVGAVVITYRPATADEIAAQEALNA